MPTKRFTRYKQPKPCLVCRKLSTYDSDGTELCQRCYDEAGLENEHSDYGHDTPVDGCPTCRRAAASP